MPLIDVAQRLRSPQIDRIVEPFRERKASVRRAVVIALATAWAAFWATKPESHFLSTEASRVLPVVIAILIATIVWAVYVNKTERWTRKWIDITGTFADFIGIGILLHLAWNLMLPLVAFLPLVCVTTGARFRGSAFKLAVLGAVVIVAISAPAGYWFSRPAVAILAVVLVAGIPYTFNRVLSGLAQISEQAIQARDSQSRFLAMMSHELRTPLHTVIHAAGLMGSYSDPKEHQALVRSITTNASVLLSRVNDVLDVAAEDDGEIALSVEAFDLRSVLETISAVVSPQAKTKDIMLTLMYDADRATILKGDPRRIEQVVTNLAANAIKYTDRGGSVVITATTTQITSDSPTSELVVSVADTGIGIPSHQRVRIFDAFTQVSSGESRTHDGVGLGLHIVQMISNRMGASIAMDDNPGGGSIFTWRVNLELATPGSNAVSTVGTTNLLEDHRNTCTPMRCLVVDDNSSNLEIMGRILTLAGHQPSFAHDGEECISLLRSSKFDLVYLDLHMPGISGLDVLRTVKNEWKSSDVPRIVVLTASTDTKAAEMASQLGAFGFLKKPLSIPALLDSLNNAAALLTIHDGGLSTSPVQILREISDRSAVRAYLLKTMAELDASAGALDATINASTSDEGDLIEPLHRLKNALISARLPEGLPLDHQLFEASSFDDVVANLPQILRLVEHAKFNLRAAPEVA